MDQTNRSNQLRKAIECVQRKGQTKTRMKMCREKAMCEEQNEVQNESTKILKAAFKWIKVPNLRDNKKSRTYGTSDLSK